MVVASVLSEVSMEVSVSEEPVVGVVTAEQPVRMQAVRITVTVCINDLFITLLFIEFYNGRIIQQEKLNIVANKQAAASIISQ